MKRTAIPFLLLLLAPLTVDAQRAYQLSSAFTYDTDTLRQVCVGCESRPDVFIRDTLFHPQLRTHAGELQASPSVIVREAALVLSLFRNSTQDPVNDIPFDSVSVRVEVKYRTDGSLLHTETVDLVIRNSSARQTAKDTRLIMDVQWADVKVIGFGASNEFTESQAQAFKLHVQILGTQDPIPHAGEHPAAVYVQHSTDRAYLKLSWDALQWARSYDLEWSYVDATSRATEPDFRASSTRIGTTETDYELPMIFDAGKLFFRVRGVGVKPDGTQQNGTWSPLSVPYTITPSQAHERNSKVWQYTAAYLDNGRRKDLLTYYDGSLRQRQQVTRLNEPGQPLIVAETLHDHEGRAAIQTLRAPIKPGTEAFTEPSGSGTDLAGATYEMVPTIAPPPGAPYIPPGNPSAAQQITSPVVTNVSSLPAGFGGIGASSAQIQLPGGFRPSLSPINVPSIAPPVGVTIDWSALMTYYTNSPALRYIPSFNVNGDGDPYSRTDFDLTSECGEVAPAPMGTLSGAGRYYSSANDLNGPHSAYVPDAGGFPFVQKVFTGDRSGRMAMQSLAGKDLKVGSGHEMTFYHAVPAQDELDRLFGNDAGDAALYTKLIARDANGQLTVQYVNSKGQVVASGLTGEAPGNLDPVAHDPAAAIVFDVQHQMGRQAEDGDANVAAGSFFVPVDNTDVRLSYSLSAADLRIADPCASSAELCYDCPKELILRIVDDCGRTIFSRRQRVGPQAEQAAQIARCDPHQTLSIDTVMRLNMGRYHVDKTLRIDRSDREAYVNDYASRDLSCFRPIPLVPSCSDLEICVPCRYTASDGAVRTYRRAAGNDPQCRRHCPESEQPFDVATYQSLLGDMMPGGQYAALDPGVEKWNVSVFNTGNLLRTRTDATAIGVSYRAPTFPYLNPNGSEAWVDVTSRPVTDYATDRARMEDGRRWVRPGDILNLELLRVQWVDSWTESLVAYHPEYAYFEWNTEHLASLSHDDRMRRAETYDEALAAAFIDADEVVDVDLLLRDPFFIAAPEHVRNEMITRLRNVAVDPGGGPVALSIYGVAKQSVACNLPVHGADITALLACIGATRIEALDAEARDAAWQIYRATYLGKKAVIMDHQRNSDLSSATHRLGGRLRNDCIETAAATPGCMPCGSSDALHNALNSCTRRVFHMACMSDGSSPERDEHGRIISWTNALDATVRNTVSWMKCSNACPQAFDLMNLMNAFAVEGRLLENMSFPAPPPFVIPMSLANGFANPRATGYTWNAEAAGNTLTITIRDGSSAEQARYRLVKTDPTLWSDIIFLNCISPFIGSTDHALSAYDREHRRMELRLTVLSGPSIGSCAEVTIGNVIITRDPSGGFRTNRNTDLSDLPEVPCCAPLSPPARYDEDCDRTAARMAEGNADRMREARASQIAEFMREAYTAGCMSSIHEQFTLSWSEPIYQVTLFHYDQAGAIIRTTPPAAVRPLADLTAVRSGRRGGAVAFPDHVAALATEYRYNAPGQVVQRTTPDGGTTRMTYDRLGRLLIAQDADQLAHGRLSYMKYDAHGRPTEQGTVTATEPMTALLTAASSSYRKEYLPVHAGMTGHQEVRTQHYDEITAGTPVAHFTGGRPTNLMGRIAAMRIRNDGVPAAGLYDHAMYFSYDAGGSLTDLVQDFESLSEVMSDPRLEEDEVKVTRYRCDPINGNLREVAYQPGATDQYYHWYDYDADGRLIQVWSGPNRFELSGTRDREATYSYYLHGPLARIEVGQENIQGKDFIYTITGWLKQVNSPSSDMVMDPGLDGTSVSAFLPDVLGIQHHYFNADYRPVGKLDAAAGTVLGDHPALFNGMASRIVTRNAGLSAATGGDRTAALCSYDQSYRLTGQDIGQPGAGAGAIASTGDLPWDDLAAMDWSVAEAFGMTVGYDRNGNISSLMRKGASGEVIDRLTYEYNGRSNRLQCMRDAAGVANPGPDADLGDQAPGNYSYDAKGRLTADASEKIALEWNSRDHLVSARRADGTVRYHYTASGMRSIVRNGAEGTFTVRDLKGSPIAVYSLRNGTALLQELPIYGQSRLGSFRPDGATGTSTHFGHDRGSKVYESSNETGDVVALVSDRRLRTDAGGAVTYQPDLLLAEDHYPFGMVKPGRELSGGAADYPFGYHGMERDDLLKGSGQHYHTEFRQYDPRVGRWMSLDPMAAKYPGLTPYAAFLNRPVGVTDPRGDDPPESAPHRSSRRLVHTIHQPGGRPALTTVDPQGLAETLVVEATRLITDDNERAVAAAQVAASFIPIDIPISMTSEENMEDRGRTMGRREASDQNVEFVTDAIGNGQTAQAAAEEADAGIAGAAYTVVIRCVAGYWSTIQNHARLSSYAGENQGFHYFLALAASRSGSGRDLLSAADLELSDANIGRLFGGHATAETREGLREGFRLAHRVLRDLRTELGSARMMELLHQYYERGGRSVEGARQYIMRETGGTERGNEAARTLGRGDRSRPSR